MRLKINRYIFLLVLGSVVQLSVISLAQPASELQRLQQKFPDKAFAYDLDEKEISVEFKKGVPYLSTKEYSSRVVLQDNTASLADFKYFFNSTFKLKELKAYSLVPEGSKFKKIPVKNFIKTAEIDDGTFYDDASAYNFIFSGVGKGTKLVVESESELFDLHIPLSFRFARYAPVEKCRLTVAIPSSVKINYHLFGGADTALIKCTIKEESDQTTYTWEATDLPSYDSDNIGPDNRYFFPHIILQVAGYEDKGRFIPVVGTVQDLYRYYYGYLKDTISEVDPEIKRLTDSLTHGLNTPESKVAAIYQWVQHKIRYIAIEDGDNGFVPSRPLDVFQRMYGDCKGKTSLLVSMLRSQGIASSFAWVGTRNLPYSFTQFPTRAFSDHMVAVWWKDANTPIVLDGTTQFHSLYEVPATIQGKECLIEKGMHDFMVFKIPVAPPFANRCSDSLIVNIDGTTLIGKGFAQFNGDRKASLLHSFTRYDSVKFKNIVSGELPKSSNKFIVNQVSHSDVNNLITPFSLTYDFTIPDYIAFGKDKMYVNLNLDPFPPNLAVDIDRKIPVEAEQTFDNTFSCTLVLPANYRVEKIPEPVDYRDPEFGFSSSYAMHDTTIQLTTRVYFNFQVIDGEKVKQFAQMLSNLRRHYSKSIVLIKNQ